MLSLGSAQIIKRKSIVVIEDSLVEGAFVDEVEIQGEDGLWVGAANLNQTRKDNSGVAVYGAWQIVKHNNLIKSPGWYLLKYDDENGRAVEIREISGSLLAVNSCEFKDGKFEGGSVKQELVITLDLEIEKLKLPKTQLLFAEEYYKTLDAKERARMRFQAVYYFVLLSGFAGWYFYSELNSKKADENLVQLNSTINQISSDRDELRLSKIKEYPKDTAILNRILNVIYIDPNAKTNGEQEFSGDIEMLVDGSISDENRVIKSGVSFIRYPTGEFKVRLKND